MVSDEDVAVIARDHLTYWEPLRPYLGLRHKQEVYISNTYPGDYGKQKRECLEVWKKIKGDQATYGALITAAEKARDQPLADAVRDLLSRTYIYIHVHVHVHAT